jgi:hypothetical protein
MRITRPTNKRALFLLPASIAVILACSASLASAETLAPWWGLTSEAQPTDLQEVQGRDEVQQLTVSATKGDVVLVNLGLFSFEEFFATGESKGRAVVPYNATASQLQEALATIYPSRKVTVTGGPGDEEGSKPYLITFPSQSVEPPVVVGGGGFLGGGALSCEGATGSHCTAEPSIAETVKGSAAANVTIVAENRGDASANGASVPVSIADKLPAGLEAVAIEEFAGNSSFFDKGPVDCSLSALTCTFSGTLPAYEVIEVHVSVVVGPGAASGRQSVATVRGGGAAASATVSQALQIGAGKRFGIEDYELAPENVGGSLDTQAGSHPFQLTSALTLNREAGPEGPQSVALPRDIVAELPTGLVGNPTPFTQCTDRQFEESVETEGESVREQVNACPAQSAIGVADITYNLHRIGLRTSRVPIFNLSPRQGEPARFGFLAEGLVPIFLDTSVRTGGDYGVTVSVHNITQIDNLLGVKLTFWGVPGDPRHDSQRGWGCLIGSAQCPKSTATSPPPFLVMPTACERPYESTLRADSWAAGVTPSFQAAPVSYRLPEALDGCNHLPFSASVGVAPDVSSASTASGLAVDVHVPQEAALNPKGLAESSLRNTTVTLPVGVGLNPAGADGLQACSEEQIGFLPGESSGDELHFTPGAPSCPDASKIGTVKIKTPLLPNALEGEVYLAAQDANPFGSLIAMYIVAKDPVSGVLVKLSGKVEPDVVSGQLVSTFKNTPQLPFEDLELHFFGGARAPLSTPALCGSYETNALFGPWSGEASVNTTSSFQITTGPNGGPCTNPLPFGPSLTGGSSNINAGAFSPLITTINREDGQQAIKSVQLHFPRGLSGILTGLPLCPETQANAGTCSQASRIGTTIVSVGVGGNPYSVTGGEVFITEHYAGAPFGLSIVNPAVAGPFNLGKVIVRAKVEVDPHTAALTVTTDSSGPHAIPTILDGIPLQIKHVNVTIDRPGFTFNPTNCNPMSINGTVASSENVASPVNVPLQVTNCAALKFAPKFAVSTQGKTSKANGASLNVKLTYPQGPAGTYANIARVKVDLPKQLPSRLTTLQKACTAAQFEANPAGCPAAAIIGHAKATTPLIPVPLEGPAYFVSHGGEAFPSLIIVLQGYGVTLDLVGTTFISKAGITSSTFKTVPDAPVGSFELTLPQGKYSALTALGNLCTSKLTMPTEFLAQNGAIIRQSTPVSVNGCPKKKTLSRAQKLAAALKLCHKDKNHAKRAKCEKTARHKYGPVKIKNKKKK